MLAMLRRLFYPPVCLLCQAPARRGLCESCVAELVENHSPCSRCALPLFDTEHSLCGRCLQKSPAFDAAWSPFVYAQPLEWMISRLKFNADLAQTPVLSQLLLQRLPVQASRPDCILPVPLHRNRLRQRGYNQSVELARPLAQALGVRLDTDSCLRWRATPPQTGMSAKQRRRNLRGAFTYSNHQRDRYVVVFDDVMTTGATLNELARLLKAQGVQRVDVWSLARAPRHNKKQ